MSDTPAAVEVMVLWHHHQPDYRSAREGGSLLPWVRLHATKDYLDMALRLGRHPGLKATFNFVPSLLDQLEHAESGGHDWLFDRLARPVASLAPEERVVLVARCSIAPRWALDRGPPPARQLARCEPAYTPPPRPLLVNVQRAPRARPVRPRPAEPFAAPEDAARQVARAIERHTRAFGAAPAGMWPPEGSVSPEVAEIVARAGIRWLATDESILWHSLPAAARRRESLYRPWSVETAAGPVAIFFRDRELSDRIGFVYQNWEANQAADDLIARLRRIRPEHRGQSVPLGSIILDGENCWESYPDDGAPFLHALYQRLDPATGLRTLTPNQALRRAPPGGGPCRSGSCPRRPTPAPPPSTNGPPRAATGSAPAGARCTARPGSCATPTTGSTATLSP